MVCLPSTKLEIRVEQVLPGSGGGWGGEGGGGVPRVEMAQTTYAHVNKFFLIGEQEGSTGSAQKWGRGEGGCGPNIAYVCK
jgi:hypothetical protein